MFGALSFFGAAMRTIHKSLIVLLLTLLALTPAAALPAAAVTDPVQAAVQWLHTKQLPDGGFGVTSLASPAMTADVIYAISLAGEDPDSAAWTVNGTSALDALAALAPTYAASDAGQAGKVARAVAAAGRNPRSFGGMDLIAVIEAAYDPATGRYHPDFQFRHTLAVEALQRAHETVPALAYTALREAQLPDGGWSWSFPDPGQSVPPSDIDTTGRVLLVLGQVPLPQCDTAESEAVLSSGASYLEQAQLASGGWADVPPPTTKPANANSTGLAVGGLRGSGRDPDAAPFIKGGQSALQALLAFQEPSGAFRYIAETGKEEVRLTATADALAGLLQDLRQVEGECHRVYLPVIIVH